MTSFKISFASDSIEGVSSLIRLSAGAGTGEPVYSLREISPPPAPGLQASDESGAGSRETTPPPLPAYLGASGSGDSDQSGVIPPPVPPLNSSGVDSDQTRSAEEFDLPPSPDQKARVKKVTKARPRQKKKST